MKRARVIFLKQLLIEEIERIQKYIDIRDSDHELTFLESKGSVLNNLLRIRKAQLGIINQKMEGEEIITPLPRGWGA